jgi:hypothetical protein
MQNMYIVYMRFWKNKPKPKYIKGKPLSKSEYDKGKDRVNKLPNRYLSLFEA